MTKTTRVPGAVLEALGRALYGEEWTGDLSRALGLSSPRAMQRWQTAARRGEDYQVSRSLLSDLEALAEARQGEAARALAALKALVRAD